MTIKLNIIHNFGEESSKIDMNYLKDSVKNLDVSKINIKISQSDIMYRVNKYIIKVKSLFYTDLDDEWGNRIIDVLITELQNKYEISYEKAEIHILKCIQDNNLPKPNRTNNTNYNICRELSELSDVQIIL